MPWGHRSPKGLALQLAYFSGAARIFESRRGGLGAILRLQRVRPARRDRFQPLKASEMTPQMLDRLLLALRRWRFEIVSIEEAVGRTAASAPSRRFACLTFDGGYRDVVSFAYPVLSRHKAPFTVYVPTGIADGIAQMWWLALEQVIARHDRISLVIDRRERHFDIVDIDDKYDLYVFLAGWMRQLAPAQLVQTVHDLCTRYSVDPAATSRAAAMNWDDVCRLAADPLATIGTATVNYPALAALTPADARREMTMGRQVAEAALGRPVPHLAFPFGDPQSAGQREAMLAAEAGFASAVTAQAGVVWGNGRSNMLALPRIAWDGRHGSLRTLRVLMSGFMRSRPAATSS